MPRNGPTTTMHEGPRCRGTKRSGSAGARPDGAVRDRVEDVLRNSAYSAVRRIACECNDSVVILKGTVPSFYLKQLAQNAVMKTVAEYQVINHVEVVYPAAKPDGQFGRAVQFKEE